MKVNPIAFETQNLEYKSGWRDEYMKSICGFANVNGGKLFIGIADNGEVVGVDAFSRLMEEIPNRVKDQLGILVEVNLHQQAEKKFIEIVVEPHAHPVNFRGRYYVRSGTTMQELKGISLDRFLLGKQGIRWDGVSVPGVFIGDLDRGAFDFFKKQAGKSQRIGSAILTDSDEHLLSNLRLMAGSYIKRSALLFFHSEPERYITGAYIKVGFFHSHHDLRFQDEIHGNLFNQVEKAMEILYAKYIRSDIFYDGINRVEKYEYPVDAIREILLNAVTHKDYSGGSPIQISVYSDQILFWNEGILPEDWSTSNLMEKHPSRPYNPDLANVFFRSGYIESWGRGTLQVVRECAAHGMPAPEFIQEAGGITVKLLKKRSEEKILKNPELNSRQKKGLIFLFSYSSIKNSEYQKLNNVSKATATRDLTELVVKYKLLERVGRSGIGTVYVLSKE